MQYLPTHLRDLPGSGNVCSRCNVRRTRDMRKYAVPPADLRVYTKQRRHLHHLRIHRMQPRHLRQYGMSTNDLCDLPAGSHLSPNLCWLMCRRSDANVKQVWRR
jgi:hypothetical protein